MLYYELTHHSFTSVVRKLSLTISDEILQTSKIFVSMITYIIDSPYTVHMVQEAEDEVSLFLIQFR